MKGNSRRRIYGTVQQIHEPDVAVTSLMTRILLLLSVIALAQAPGVQAASGRAEELQHLLLHDCGSCHGMTMKGGIGPSLLPENLAGKADSFLIATILEGRSGTPMPPWRGILTADDAAWLVRTLRERATP
jgi:cytochrome c55X